MKCFLIEWFVGSILKIEIGVALLKGYCFTPSSFVYFLLLNRTSESTISQFHYIASPNDVFCEQPLPVTSMRFNFSSVLRFNGTDDSGKRFVTHKSRDCSRKFQQNSGKITQ
jgi:hypothetical protein